MATRQPVKIDMEARNREFQAMTPEQKRVAVAKDVIEYIAMRRFRPRAQNGYLVVESDVRRMKGKDLCVLLEKGRPQCQVCAIGAVFMAAVGWMDAFPADKFYPSQDGIDAGDSLMVDYMRGFFEEDQLRLMEWAFEIVHTFSYTRATCDSDEHYQAKVWGKQYQSDATRLRAIMENVIANNGTFDPANPAPNQSAPTESAKDPVGTAIPI